MSRKIILFTIFITVFFYLYISPLPRETFSPQYAPPIVVIDAGHGGIDGGAVGISGVEEKQLNLEISRKLQDLFGFVGIETVMTRRDDESIHKAGKSIRQKKVSDIKTRVDIVNETENAFLISIHLNHFSLASCRGAQVFYAGDEESRKTAVSVQEALRLLLDKSNKRVPQKAGRNIYLLNNINCPGILIECGFLSNPKEEKLLQEEDYQKKIALSAVLGFADCCKDVYGYES